MRAVHFTNWLESAEAVKRRKWNNSLLSGCFHFLAASWINAQCRNGEQRVSGVPMGHGYGLIINPAINQRAIAKYPSGIGGREMNVTVHDGGSITFTPLRQVISADIAAV